MNTFRTLCVMASLCGLSLFGQADTGMGALSPLMRDMGVVAVLVWHLWYQVSKVQPRHEKAMNDQAEAFNNTVIEMTRNCAARRDAETE